MSKKLSPLFFDGTMRQWTRQKRREWNAVIKAFDVFRLGCAYTPAYPKYVDQIASALKGGKSAMSPKQWKRTK